MMRTHPVDPPATDWRRAQEFHTPYCAGYMLTLRSSIPSVDMCSTLITLSVWAS